MMIHPSKSYSRQDIEVFNVLKHPIWIFDIERKAMWWANDAALQVWGAPSLEELLSRDYASDLTEATELRMKDRMKRMKLGETSREQWTFYPAGKAKTLQIVGSAIRIDDGRMAILSEAEIPNNDFDVSTTRGFGLFVHVSIAVCEYCMEGKPIYRNSEDLKMFGSTFLDRFVDQTLGERLLKKVQDGEAADAEAEQILIDGTSRWFAVSLRTARDPVSADPVFIYSARDITEIIKARAESVRARMKSEFLTVIAHELRTPLHQVIGYADLLELTPLSEAQRESVQLIERSTESLMAIINDLLDYSTLEEGKLKVSRLNFSLPKFLAGCITTLGESRAALKDLTWSQDISAGLPDRVIGDPHKLKQILQNILENAVKFTSKGGSVAFRAHPTTQQDGELWVRFEVQDTGIGIDNKDKGHIFEEYHQINMANTRSFEGTGLGLAICKGLCDVMGGKIGVESTVGQGSTFSVELPFIIPMEKDRCLPAQALHFMATNALRILIVEDNRVSQKMADRMIQKMGHQTLLAENGQVALDVIEREQVDLVLMDIQMPGTILQYG